MRFTQEMIDLRKSPRYEPTRTLLYDILNRRDPDMGLLKYLFNDVAAKNIAKSISRLYSNPNFVTGTIRNHENAPTLLSNARHDVDNDDDFGAMEQYLAPQVDRVESIDNLVKEVRSEIGNNIQKKFGNYYKEYVIKETALAIHHQSARKCGISKVCHWMGAAGLMYYLQLNKHIPEHANFYFRVMVAFSHDFKEDLPRVVLHKDKKPYGLYRTDEFGSDFLPSGNDLDKELLGDINILTNLYTEVPKYAYAQFKSQHSTFTAEKFQKFLTDYMENNIDIYSSMYKIHRNLSNFMSKQDYGSLTDQKLLDAIAWDTYEFYVNRIWRKSIKFKDDTPIITKFCDQSYNFMGKDVLSDDDLIKNLQKLGLWAGEVYGSAINLPHTNNFVQELLEDALCFAEHYIIKDLMKTEANILFTNSKFPAIIKLEPIFYTDKKLQSGHILSNK